MEIDVMHPYRPGTLWQRVVETSETALRKGALRPIPTSLECLEDGGVRFLVRVVQHLAEKPKDEFGEKAESGHVVRAARRTPFLPYDPDLFVAEASTGHVCLLNKFNVVDHHLLIVTRDFVHQDCPLEPADFDVWWQCLNEYESLGFYNGGTLAGASQPHRHMQLIPLPLADAGPRIPIEPLLAFEGSVPRLRSPCDRAPFQHACVSLEPWIGDSVIEVSQQLHRLYLDLLDLTAVSTPRRPDGRLTRAYNLLLTRQWMLLVPRQREHFAGISLNAMAFAGAFLARNQQEFDQLRRCGPMAALSFVAG